jgi:hypothetical protein
MMGKGLILLLPAALLCVACYTRISHPLLTEGTRIETVGPGSDCRACHDEALYHDDLLHRWWLSFADLPEGEPWIPAWERRAHQPWWREGSVVHTAAGPAAPGPDDGPGEAAWSGSVGAGVASGRIAPPPRVAAEGGPPPPGVSDEGGTPPPARPAVKSPRQRPAAADSSKAGNTPGRDS